MKGRNTHNYRPWLDGVRAIAILMVLVEHTGIFHFLRFNFGGTGVGIFFALSGYLITDLLLTELDRTGDIALRQFYIRRLARLMPALVVVVAVGDLFFLWFGNVETLRNSIFALTYLTNYGTIFHGAHLSGFGHTWSLAVEEHFYLLWPACLMLLARRFDLRRILLCTLGICVAVLIWRSVLFQLVTNPRVLYVGSIERADALLYGCAGAMVLRMGWRPPKILFYVGVACIAFYASRISNWAPINSAVLAIGSTFVVMCLDHCTLAVRRVLSYAPIVWIGIMSYGIYLWHGVLFQIAAEMHYSERQSSLIVISLSVAIAYCSYRWVESPVRNFVRSREQAKRAAPPTQIHKAASLES